MLIKRLGTRSINIKISEPYFLGLLTASFLATIFLSRYDYLREFLIGGVLAARSSSTAGHGGWYSGLTICFYPLCALAAVTGMRRSTYLYTLVLLLVVATVDCYVLGTRNVPFFALLFHFLSFRGQFGKPLLLIGGLLGLISLVTLINYQTINRSLDPLMGGWNWSNTLKHTWIADSMPINENAFSLMEGTGSFLQPFLYLLLYVSHSIGECAEAFANMADKWLATPNYLLDQVCLILQCNREPFAEAIKSNNLRTGLYQTLYVSLFYDFGFGGFLAIILFVGLVLRLLVLNLVLPLIIYFSVILSISPIENYFYNGFGLGRAVLFIVLWLVLTNNVNKLS
ncbi:MAG: hypothetical protein FJ116_01690 [Deltaproteobacteria bacterium]|nr:hypothetical protein [Deltaproteobacteria bacterium]